MCKPEGCKKEFCGKAAKKDQPANDDTKPVRTCGTKQPPQPPAAKKSCICGGC